MKTIEVVAAIFLKENRVLCMQRKESSHKETSLKFEFPGGKIEEGESFLEALKREIKEEMNLSLKFREEDFFMTVHYSYQNFHLIMHSYLYIIENQDFNFEMKEHISFQWSSKGTLKNFDWAPADLPIVQKLEEMLSSS